jgi:hypothetical protein
MRRRRFKIVLVLFALAAASSMLALARRGPRAAGPMRQEVYVWQRAWTDDVRDAVRHRGRHFSQVAALGAQVWWSHGQPRVARVAVDWPSLRSAGASVGLAIRINEYAGPFDPRADSTRLLCDLASELLGEARAASVPVTEIQIDFDAAESKLDGYRAWVEAIGSRISPTPVVITALPSWLDAPAFEPLARACGRYVLQVHSFERPKLSERMTLCDPSAARAAVERAGRIGVPFRVALPTYGYQVAFDPAGKFIGLSAEGRSPDWPADAIVKEVRANAGDMAALIATWNADRPPAMSGVIWYRLPTDADRINWRWPTLAAAMEGRAPRSDLRVVTREEEQGVGTLELHNDGEADEALALTVVAHSPAGRIVSADAQGGFSCTFTAAEARFDGRGLPASLAAGERRVIGWVRTRGQKVVTRVER